LKLRAIGDFMNDEDDFKLLNQIDYPKTLRQLQETDLPVLATELRDFLLHSVSRTGGHLSSNLGVVELTIALHYRQIHRLVHRFFLFVLHRWLEPIA